MFGDAPVPWHALAIVFVIAFKALEQALEQEQRGPLLKWASLQSSMGVLYASVHASGKPTKAWIWERLSDAWTSVVMVRTKKNIRPMVKRIMLV